MVLMIVAGLISMNLSAQKSINTHELQKFSNTLFRSTEQIVAAFTRSTAKSEVFDEDIRLEDWMMDLNQWAVSMDNKVPAVKSIKTEGEEHLEEDLDFEEWMFKTDWLEEKDTISSDPEMEMEGWMMNPFEWTNTYCANTSGRK